MEGVITLFAYRVQRVIVNPNPPQESNIYSFIGGLLIGIIHMYVEPSIMMKKEMGKKKKKERRKEKKTEEAAFLIWMEPYLLYDHYREDLKFLSKLGGIRSS